MTLRRLATFHEMIVMAVKVASVVGQEQDH
jgi:hypothetical protein